MIYHNGEYNFDGLDSQLRRASKKLRPYLGSFTSIVVTGMSGVVFGAPLALRLRVPLVVLRKGDDNSHHTRWGDDGEFVFINGENLGKHPLWVDDFVSGGSTRGRIELALNSVGRSITGHQYLYRDNTLMLRGKHV